MTPNLERIDIVKKAIVARNNFIMEKFFESGDSGENFLLTGDLADEWPQEISKLTYRDQYFDQENLIEEAIVKAFKAIDFFIDNPDYEGEELPDAEEDDDDPDDI